MSIEIRDDPDKGGGKLSPPAVEIVGPKGAPVVVVLGGISASRHVTATAENPRAGWWDSFVGHDKTIDTNRFRVLSMDYQVVGRKGQPLTTYDQAFALIAALDTLGIESVRAIIGASYGGMVALAFGALASQRVEQLVIIGAAHESTALSTALRILQRRVVDLGVRTGQARAAVAIARGLAMTTYSTPQDFSDRFPADDSNPLITRGLIEDFLASSGEGFAQSCSPERYLAISESLDLHHVKPEDISVPTTLIAVEEDTLVPIGQLRELAKRFGGRCHLVELSSRYGHDTFLLDPDLLAPHVHRSLSTLALKVS
jgi:homoserine O-acetyltransferase